MTYSRRASPSAPAGQSAGGRPGGTGGAGLILALDPGQRKLGWALVDTEGRALRLGIWPESSWEERLQELQGSGALDQLAAVVLGDGTWRMNIEAGLRRLLPQASIAVVNEVGSTVDGWKLKREHVAGGNPFKALWFMFGQLFYAGPIDDYAAWVLALRYLKSRAQ